MANTYTQLYVHVVFSVKGRSNLISTKWKEDLYKYITGIITNEKQKLMIINGMPDHIHLLIGLGPDCKLSDLVRTIKANSSKWINESSFILEKFQWQKGFGAFSIGTSSVNTVINYIKTQEEHHHRKTFREEYIEFLTTYQIDYDINYILDNE